MGNTPLYGARTRPQKVIQMAGILGIQAVGLGALIGSDAKSTGGILSMSVPVIALGSMELLDGADPGGTPIFSEGITSILMGLISGMTVLGQGKGAGMALTAGATSAIAYSSVIGIGGRYAGDMAS